MKKGLLIILSGPSGVGKGTVRKYIVKTGLVPLYFSVSMTTRKPREGEVDGKDYFFVSQERFNEAVKNNELLEYASFVGNSYGTPKAVVEDMRNKGMNVFLEIEAKGASQVLEAVKDDRVISFFLMPPSVNTLKRRLTNRKTESPEIIKERVEKGLREMSESSKYQYIIVNDRIKRAGNEIIDTINQKLKN